MSILKGLHGLLKGEEVLIAQQWILRQVPATTTMVEAKFEEEAAQTPMKVTLSRTCHHYLHVGNQSTRDDRTRCP